MKRTLLLASIAFIPTFALAQAPAQTSALPDRPTIVAQRANDDDNANAKQKQRQQNRAQRQEQQQKRQDAQQKKRAQQQEKRQNVKQDAKKDAKQNTKQDAKKNTKQNTKQDAKQDARQEKRLQDRKEAQQNKREQQRKDAQKEKREDRRDSAQEKREEKRDDKRDVRQERREDKREVREERREDRRMDKIRAERKETREGNRTIIRERDRTIIRDGNRTVIRHDDTERFRRAGANVQVVRRGDRTEHVIVRPGGVRVVSVYNNRGQLVRRTRVVNGRQYVLFNNNPAVGFGFIIKVPPPVIRIPRERYIVEYRSAPRPWIYETLVAPPVMPIERAFTLDQVRYNYDVRARMPRIDIDTITFDSGSWDIRPDQAAKLEPLADGMRRVIAKNPNEVFLVEGHTDAVGDEDDNLSLSDRRAQAVAEILTEQFQVPPENMIPQGYGEENLKVDTQASDERNRYVSVRRVTPLLAQQEASGQQ
jgi:outer membrane protein OmpA-like peptidoglycan-associated protein